MSTNARRSPRNHGSTATAMSHLPTSNNHVNNVASSSISTSRHLSSTTRNQPNGQPTPSRPRYSGSPKETRTVGSTISHQGAHGYLSSNGQVSHAHSPVSMGMTASGLGIVGGGVSMQGSLSASGSGASSSVNSSNAGNGSMQSGGNLKSSPHATSHPHHYSPYHTRSTPNLTTGSTSASCSPVLLSPAGSPVIGPPAGIRDTHQRNSHIQKETGLPEIVEPIVYGSTGEARPVTPNRNRRFGPVLSKSPERDLPGPGTGTAKYRAGLSVEGILMQSGGADKVNTNANGLMGQGGMTGTRNGGTRNAKGKGVDYGDRSVDRLRDRQSCGGPG